MFTRRRSPPVIYLFAFGFIAFAMIFDCRAAELVSNLRQRRTGVTAVAAQAARRTPSPTAARVAPVETPTETPTTPPTATLEPSPTEFPSDTPEPADTATPRPTSTPVPPTRKPLPTQTFTPAPPPSPTRCPQEYCVTKATCIPDNNTRATGIVYENGVPKNGVRVRVSYADGGAPAAADFISGHDPINRDKLDPHNPGYYQVGIREGAAFDGNWWVFLMDDTGQNEISEGRWFKSTAVVTASSCQVGITDFSK